MANDALDAGPRGDYPWWPRRSDGRSRMPFGLQKQRGPEGVILVDVTPRINGNPVGPPDHLAAVAAAGIT